MSSSSSGMRADFLTISYVLLFKSLPQVLIILPFDFMDLSRRKLLISRLIKNGVLTLEMRVKNWFYFQLTRLSQLALPRSGETAEWIFEYALSVDANFSVLVKLWNAKPLRPRLFFGKCFSVTRRAGIFSFEFFWNIDLKDPVNLNSSVLFAGLITYIRSNGWNRCT